MSVAQLRTNSTIYLQCQNTATIRLSSNKNSSQADAWRVVDINDLADIGLYRVRSLIMIVQTFILQSDTFKFGRRKRQESGKFQTGVLQICVRSLFDLNFTSKLQRPIFCNTLATLNVLRKRPHVESTCVRHGHVLNCQVL